MAQAALNIEGMAFCSLDILESPMPPSMNLIEKIWIMEGFGMGLPAMKLSLFDENETLSRDLNLREGSPISIRLGRTADTAPEMKFRVFGWTRPRNSSGKVLHLVCIYDCPEFGAGSYAESFEGNTSNVMQQIAERSKLQYDGPKGSTVDNQVWLNMNTTRIAFTEELAMRGYMSDQSCMSRLVRMDGTLAYKDLIEVLKTTPKHTLVHNAGDNGTEGTAVNVRMAEDKSLAGLFSHYMNYGFKMFGHSFDEPDAKFGIEKMDLTAPGTAGVPVNMDIVGRLSERGARVAYAGMDPGTGPDEGFNVHENYERALYQNMRLLGMFSERMVVLTDSATEIKSLESIDFVQGPGAKGTARPAPNDVAGRYVVGGKTLMIIGSKYCEVFYLYRPFLTEAGNPNGTNAPKQTVSASSSGVNTSSRNFT